MKYKFKKDAEEYHGTEDNWYALTNGYINPADMLADKDQLKNVTKAIEILQDFFDQAETAQLIGEEFDEDIEEDN